MLGTIVTAGAAVLGIGGHLAAKDTNKEARKVAEKAQNMYDDAKVSLESAKTNMEESLLAFGYAKTNVLETSVEQFLQGFERIKDVRLDIKEEDFKYMVNEQSALKMRKMSDIYSVSIAGGATGAAAGVVIGLAASGSLSIVTGGMSLAGAVLTTGDVVGAAAVAGSSLTLGLSFTPLALIAAPVVAFTGISASSKADENLEKANAMLAEANVAVEKMKTSETMCDAIAKRSDMFRGLLMDLNEIFAQFAEKLDKMTEEKINSHDGRRLKAKDFSPEEEKLIAVTLSLAGAVKAVIDVPLLSKEGTLTNESETVYEEVQSDYNDKIEKGIIQKPEKNEKMFCTGCGKEIMRDSKFCNYCGKKNTYDT